MFLHPKFSHSPPEIFPFPTRNFLMTTTKIILQAILNRNFHPIFSHDFLVIIYQTISSLHPIILENVLVSGDFYRPRFLLFLLKRARKVPVRHDLLYDTAILTYKIYIPHFHFPVCRTSAYRHKKALLVITIR